MQELRAYLDYNATSPLRPEARDAVRAALELTGNPSSVHAAGRAARRLIEDSREKVAGLIGCMPSQIVFTSGGSEANALALAPRSPDGRLLASAVEHSSALSGGRYPTDRLERIPVDRDGVVDLDWLEARLSRAPSVSCVSVMAANNETGVIQPIEPIVELAHMNGALIHCDAVQLAGRLPLHVLAEADLITLSAHKIGGPQGSGALVVRNACVTPLFRGGGQERSLRAGTENVAGIAGFGVAAELAASDLPQGKGVARLRDSLEAGVRAISPDAVIFGEGAARIGNTTCFAVPGVSAEKVVIALDLQGIAVSSGAACSSGKVGPSHVLEAMGVDPHLAGGAIRVSLGWASSAEDIERFMTAWRRVVTSLTRRRREEAA